MTIVWYPPFHRRSHGCAGAGAVDRQKIQKGTIAYRLPKGNRQL